MDFYSMNRSDLHKHFIRNAYNYLNRHLIDMTEDEKRSKEKMLQYLSSEREKIVNASPHGIDPDLLTTINAINDRISRLKQELHEEHCNEVYATFEDNS